MLQRQTWAVLAFLLIAGFARADTILDYFGATTTTNNWAYSSDIGVGRGNSTTYVPELGDLHNLIYQGLVFYPGSGGPGNPAVGWIHENPALFDEDTTRVFTTYALSDTNVSIPVLLDGDDGHSIYVNGVFLGGGGFGVAVDTAINLQAGIPTEIELLGYNGPGGWELTFERQDGSVLTDTPGVRFDADGIFATPEPSSLSLMGMGVLALLGHRCFARRSASRRQASTL